MHALLTRPGRRTPGAVPIHLLTGIAECGVCGGPVHAGAARRKGSAEERSASANRGASTFSSHRTYRCKNGAHFARAAEEVDKYIESLVIWTLAQDRAVELIRSRSGPDAAKLRIEEKRLRQRLDVLAAAYADGDDDPALAVTQLRDASRSLNEKIARIQQQLAELGRVDVIGEFVLSDARSLAERGAAIEQRWVNSSVEKRRAVISSLLQIRLHPPGRGVRTFRPESVELNWLRS